MYPGQPTFLRGWRLDRLIHLLLACARGLVKDLVLFTEPLKHSEPDLHGVPPRF